VKYFNYIVYFFLIFYNLNFILASAPGDTLRIKLTLPIEARFSTVDNLGNIYVITPNNAIVKHAPDGKILAMYTYNRLGKMARLDASNPMRILVWYPDFRTVQFLDRTLNLLGTLNLIEAGYPEVRTLCMAMDGNLWLYDEAGFRLYKISPEGNRVTESQALNQLMDESLYPTCLSDDGNEVWASDSRVGVLCFDAYGQFTDRWPLTGIEQFAARPPYLWWVNEGVLHGVARGRPGEQRLVLSTPFDPTTIWVAPAYVLIGQKEQLLVAEIPKF
jgi:hypothetical protein